MQWICCVIKLPYKTKSTFSSWFCRALKNSSRIGNLYHVLFTSQDSLKRKRWTNNKRSYYPLHRIVGRGKPEVAGGFEGHRFIWGPGNLENFRGRRRRYGSPLLLAPVSCRRDFWRETYPFMWCFFNLCSYGHI